jgi:hypothetical protein
MLFEHAVFLVKNVFQFPLSIGQIIGDFVYNRERAQNDRMIPNTVI